MNPKNSSANKNEFPRRRAPLLKTIALAAAFLGLFWSFPAGAYPRHNGEYLFWSQMPAPARVLADYKGANDFETAASQRAALELLKTLVSMAADGTGQTPWPPRVSQLYNGYIRALPDVDGRHDELLAESGRLLADPSFVQTALKRYFSADAVSEINLVRVGAQTPPAAVQPGRSTKGNTIKNVADFVAAHLIACAICVIPMVMWLSRIFRVFFPFRTTSDDPPQFKAAFTSYTLQTFTGIVGGSATRSDTSVSGSIHTIPGSPSLGIGGRVEGSVTSTTVVTDSFRLVDPVTRKEANFQLNDFGLELWAGQIASVAWAMRGDERTYLVVVNHTTDQMFGKNKSVRDIYIRPSPFWTFLLVISFLIPPLWLVIIPWGILVEVQVVRFYRSGIRPLLQALNRKAETLSPGSK